MGLAPARREARPRGQSTGTGRPMQCLPRACASGTAPRTLTPLASPAGAAQMGPGSPPGVTSSHISTRPRHPDHHSPLPSPSCSPLTIQFRAHNCPDCRPVRWDAHLLTSTSYPDSRCHSSSPCPPLPSPTGGSHGCFLVALTVYIKAGPERARKLPPRILLSGSDQFFSKR